VFSFAYQTDQQDSLAALELDLGTFQIAGQLERPLKAVIRNLHGIMAASVFQTPVAAESIESNL
jgi:hypothetical protein